MLMRLLHREINKILLRPLWARHKYYKINTKILRSDSGYRARKIYSFHCSSGFATLIKVMRLGLYIVAKNHVNSEKFLKGSRRHEA
jgi:hypothetical protein